MAFASLYLRSFALSAPLDRTSANLGRLHHSLAFLVRGSPLNLRRIATSIRWVAVHIVSKDSEQQNPVDSADVSAANTEDILGPLSDRISPVHQPD